MGCFIVDKEAIFHLAEIFEVDPKRCDKYNRICHKLLEYMDLIDKYRVDEYGINEELKPIVQSMQKTFDSLPPNFETLSTNDKCKPDNVRTFLMGIYQRNEGGNEINDAFEYKDKYAGTEMTVFDAIAIINRAFALIGTYTTPMEPRDHCEQIYIPYSVMARIQLDCQSVYRKYCSDIKDFAKYGYRTQLKIISFLIDIFRCIYLGLKLFDEKVEAQRDMSECPLVIVLMPKILVAANQLMILKNYKTNEYYHKLNADFKYTRNWDELS